MGPLAGLGGGLLHQLSTNYHHHYYYYYSSLPLLLLLPLVGGPLDHLPSAEASLSRLATLAVHAFSQSFSTRA